MKKHILRFMCFVICALCAMTASAARTVSIVSVSDSSVTLAFGATDGVAYTLAWGYGASDGGSATNDWDTFETLGSVAANATTQTVALPSGWGDSVTHLRFFLIESAPPATPYAKRLEYIASAGDAWINTGIKGQVGITAEVDFSCTTDADATVLGSRKGNDRFFPVHWNWKKIVRVLGSWDETKSTAAALNTRYLARATLANGTQSLHVDGANISAAAGTASSSIATTYDMYLFAANIDGTAKQNFSGRIYSVRIWSGDTLVRDFVPCEDENGEACLWDFVSGQYFRNIGTGSFTKGDAVATAPRVMAVSAALAASDSTFGRSVSVDSITGGSATLSFGSSDGNAYTLAWGYGDNDGGAVTNGWDVFETLGTVAADAVTTSVTLPAGFGSSVSHLRFFLLAPEAQPFSKRLAYIQSSGSQWIDTGIQGKMGVAAELDVEPVSMGDNTVLGSRKDTGDTRFYLVHWNSSDLLGAIGGGNYGVKKGYWYWTGKNTIVPAGTRRLVRSVFESGNQTVALDGTEIAASTYRSSFDSGNTMYLFANHNGSSASYGASAKLYGAKIWQGETLVRDFVPCENESEVACLYDRVSGSYFTAGAGTFTKGGEVAAGLAVVAATASISAADYGEPDEYLDYIEATGEQYIDTGVNAETGLKVRADFSWEGTIDNNTDWGLVGARNGNVRMLMVHMYRTRPFVGYGTNSRCNPANASHYTSGTRVEVVADFSAVSSLEFYQNGNKTFGASEPADTSMTPFAEQGAVDLGIPLYLFAYNYAGTATGKAKAKLHELKILRADGNGGFDLVRHYLPARKGGIAGLYDKATGRFYGSATATAFEAPSTALPRPMKTLAWVQSDGDDGSRRLWLDTGVIAKSGIRSDIDFTLKDTPTATNERGILTSRGSAGSDTRFYLAYHYHGHFIYGYKTFFDSQVAAEKDARYRIVGSLDEGAQSVTVNDAELNSGASTSTGYLNAGNTLALFCYRDSTGTSYHSAIRLYSLKLWDGDEALRDYVPCLADNGQAGLYDRVTERVFFPVAKNAGATSAFYLDSEVGVAETETVSAVTVDWTNGAMLLGAQIAANGVLDLVNVPADAKLGGATIPVTLHQTTDAANFASWTVRVNGEATDYKLYWNGNSLRIPAGCLIMVF